MAATWIIADVDGCLTPEESIPWDLDALWKLAELSRGASAGTSALAPLTLCTGRPQPYVEVLMKLLDIRLPAICENGAVIYSLEDNYARFAPGVTEDKLFGLRNLRGYIETVLLVETPEAVLQFGKEAQISVFSQDPTVFAGLRAGIEGFVQDHGGPPLDITASHYYLNISLKGVNKGRALGWLCNKLGGGRAQLAGIGDTEGDLPLREAVGFFACPSNASPPIQEVADYVSPYPMLEGVLDILARPECQRA